VWHRHHPWGGRTEGKGGEGDEGAASTDSGVGRGHRFVEATRWEGRGTEARASGRVQVLAHHPAAGRWCDSLRIA
jgi:hypothetical protein